MTKRRLCETLCVCVRVCLVGRRDAGPREQAFPKAFGKLPHQRQGHHFRWRGNFRQARRKLVGSSLEAFGKLAGSLREASLPT